MLKFDVKRKINTLRDILVGKIPDPKSQVEQITIAMIYKFMDDIDQEALEFGGKRKFFANTEREKYEKYAWSNLMNPQNSGEMRSELYREGIEKMNSNPNLPQLFRDIFRNAYIPFRDSETINMFLKEIDDFTYDNSEDLGNAYEMLLMIMGSQGDAGQFRTPRHIIDMIVDIVQPQKEDTILDPACGTGGFLISAFKYIINANKDKDGKSTLTPDEKNRLTKNIIGYDISQDMVRLSRVNMYLHNFPDPKIYEYDTLSSQDRWDDSFDIILANPPFMTPKGGINPHNRFQIQAKRSEILFVDYIAEHLTVNGKAGVIVPEGIVFQSANAYKDLRKMLVENDYLYAVISLPAGVFNPYSGVKTSILLMDRALARMTDDILFVKVENDGFDLGAQRREISDNDIPRTVEFINKYKQAIIKGEVIELSKYEKEFVVIASKERVKGQDYTLVSERYREISINSHGKWPYIELGDKKYFEIESGGTPDSKKEEYWNGDINWATLTDLPPTNFITELAETKRKITIKGLKHSSAKLLPPETVLVSTRATIGRVAIAKTNLCTNQGFKNIVIKDKSQVYPKFVALMLTNLTDKMLQLASGGTFKEISKSSFSTLQIPIPPPSVQEKIVAEIEGYQKIIDGAKQVVENYKPTITIDPKWELVKLGDISKLITKGTTPTTNGYKFEKEGVSFVKIESINENGYIDKDKLSFISLDCHKSLKRSQLEKNDILFSIAGSMGISAIVTKEILPANTNQALAIIRLKENFNPYYVLNYLRSSNILFEIELLKVGVAQFNLSLKQIADIKVPLPPPSVQQEIVDHINEEQSIVIQNKRLIEMFENKIRNKIAEIWGE